jgi:hypothetical protein
MSIDYTTQRTYDEAIRAAEDEGRGHVRGYYARLTEERGLSAERAFVVTTQKFVRTDDAWSGRGNDLRRAYHDGAAAALEGLADEILARD